MKEFKNIIFDLGGVILDIEYEKTIEAFRDLGVEGAGILYSKSSQISLFDDLEKGNISEEEFYDRFRKLSKTELRNDQIRNAWNALLIGLPELNVKLLSDLKKKHRLFLLSNTNVIHEAAYREMITKQYGRFIFDELFEKMYLSHHLHLRKPDAEIFEYVIKDSKLSKDETCFIDDSPQHVEAARKVRISSFHMKNKSLVEIIDNEELLFTI
jgi:FMN phosphatase YigB (HAD superfamily)